MKKISTAFFVLASMFILMLSSCEYDFITPEKIAPPPPSGGGGTGTTGYSYATDIQPIWNAGCITSGCHPTGAVSPDLTAGKSYNAIMNGGYVSTSNPTQSKLYTKCATGGSMARFLTTAQAAIILEWIKQGAKNN